MDKGTRNRIQAATQKARALLEAEFTAQLEGVFDVRADGTLGEAADYLSGAQSVIREKIIAAIDYIRGGGEEVFGGVH